MPRSIYKYFAFGNLLVALLLIFAFTPLTETIEVVSEKTVPTLKQLNDSNTDYVQRMLTSIQAEATRAKVAFWIVVAWLFMSAAVWWWLQRRRAAEELPSE